MPAVARCGRRRLGCHWPATARPPLGLQAPTPTHQKVPASRASSHRRRANLQLALRTPASPIQDDYNLPDTSGILLYDNAKSRENGAARQSPNRPHCNECGQLCPGHPLCANVPENATPYAAAKKVKTHPKHPDRGTFACLKVYAPCNGRPRDSTRKARQMERELSRTVAQFTPSPTMSPA